MYITTDKWFLCGVLLAVLLVPALFGCGGEPVAPVPDKRLSYFEVVRVFEAPGNATEDLVYLGGVLFVTDSEPPGAIYRVSADSGEVLLGIETPYAVPGAIATDGVYLYVANPDDGTVHKHSTGGSLDEVEAYDTGLAEIRALFYDDGYYYAYDRQNRAVFRFDAAFDPVGSFPLDVGEKNIRGMDYAEGHLWSAEANGGWLLVHDENFNFSVIGEFATPGPSPVGIAYDGRYLVVADTAQKRIYKLDISTY